MSNLVVGKIEFAPAPSRYSAANDNVAPKWDGGCTHCDMGRKSCICPGPPNETPLQFRNAPKLGETGGLVGGQYIGLTRTPQPTAQQQTIKAYDKAVEAWRAATDRKQSGLEALASLQGYAYLASPYSKYPYGHAEAARVACAVTAALMRRGIVVYSPIAHGHAVAEHGLPLDWPFWKRQCDPLLAGAAALVILEAQGWWESVGMQYELDTFIGTGRPIQYAEPGDFDVVEGRA